MLTDVIPDHVAIAVPDLDAAMPRWEGDLGGRTSGWFSNGVFRSRQLRYRGGAKVELLAPHERDTSDDNFVRQFLHRRGATIHHVTLKIPDIHVAVAQAEAAGFDVVDLDDTDELWKEAFLRPSQVGGVIVQLAQNGESDAVWAERVGCDYEDPPADGAVVSGPRLTHPDPSAAAEVWRLLGAQVTAENEDVLVSWPTGPLRLRITPGPRAAGIGIEVTGAGPRPQDPTLGTAVLPDRSA